MLKKKYIPLTVISVIVIVFLIAIISINLKDGIISIKNNTTTTISGLKIIYSGSNSVVEVPEISQGQKYKTKLAFPNNFKEGSIKIIYADKQGIDHEEYLEGYIENGYKEDINININSIDKEGNLSVNVYKRRGLVRIF